MITAEQLESNKKRFQEANLKFNIFTKELEEFLGDEFYIAPATSTLDMYGCFPGGLLNHCLRSAEYADKINNTLPKNMKVPRSSIVKCAFLSQIGRVFLFCPNTNEWQIKTLKRLYEFCDDAVSLKVGERSIYYCIQYGVLLTEEEFQTILNLDKESTDRTGKYRASILSHVMRIGIELSILEEKNELNG